MTLLLARELRLPLDAVTQKLAFLGRTGGGKTYAAMKLAELMLEERAQVIALDPVGVWHGLRLGPHPFDVPVFGGLHGDVPLEPASGAMVADAIVNRRISAVLDVSQMVGTEPAKFATAFAERFFQRQKARPSAVHIFIEECQEFIPQNTTKGLGQEHMLHQFQRLIKIGRNFGIGVSMISQRPQEVNKKVLNQTECLLAFQMTGPQERKAIESWVQDKEDAEAVDINELLPKLRVGNAHVWSPQWLKFRGVVKILPKRTADVSSTPRVGGHAQTVKLSKLDLDALREDMAALIERATEEDPEVLKRRIFLLEKQLGKASKVENVTDVVAKSVDRPYPIFDDANFKELEGVILAQVGEIAQAGNHAKAEIQGALKQYKDECRRTATELRKVRPEELKKEALRGRVRENIAKVRAKANGSPSSLPKVERLILTALAQHDPRKMDRSELALQIGYHGNSKGFSNGLSALRSRGAITSDGHRGMQILNVGLHELGEFEKLPEGPELLDWYCTNKLTPAEGRILHAIAVSSGLSRDELAEKVGYHPNSKSFANGLSRLRGFRLISGRSELALGEELSS